VVAVDTVSVVSLLRYVFTSAAARTSPAVKVFLGIGFLWSFYSLLLVGKAVIVQLAKHRVIQDKDGKVKAF
jgi:hypothetical protein